MQEEEKQSAGVETPAETDALTGEKPVGANQEAAKPEGEREPDKKADDAGDDASDKGKKSGLTRLKERLSEREARIAALEAQLLAKRDDAKPPRLEDFSDYEAYDAARMSWAAENAALRVSMKTHEAELAQVKGEAQSILLNAHMARVEDARKSLDDWDAVISKANDIHVSAGLQRSIVESEKSALLLYHLAQRPGEVAQLEAMPPEQRARRLGQIEARLSFPSKRTETNAPPPVAGLKGGSSPIKGIGTTMTDYAKWREGA